MTAIAIQNKSEILKRIAAGDKIADIGKSYDVTQQAISKQLLSDPEWIDARMSGGFSKDRVLGKGNRSDQSRNPSGCTRARARDAGSCKVECRKRIP